MPIDLESSPPCTRRLLSIDVDRWWKLREGMPCEVAVHLTVEPATFEPSYRRINGLQTPLMIEWE